MNPTPDSLLASLTSPGADTRARNEELRALVRRSSALDRAQEWLRVFEQFLPAGVEPPLRDYLQYALLGVCLGFVERGLSPFVAEHLAIIPPLLGDVEAVFAQATAQGSEVAPKEFRFRALDYGIHKAYYLDWTLYMSKECY
jgi:hypothetical protein